MPSFKCLQTTLCACGLAWLSSAAWADPLELIINRKSDSVTIYLAAPLDIAAQRFGGLPPQLQPGPDGMDTETLREGTLDSTDWFIARSQARLGGTEAPLEPLSIMIHPSDLELPFETPHDGLMAISVCTAPPSTAQPPSAFTLYAGLYLYPVDGRQALDLELGSFGPNQTQILVREYWDWDALGPAELHQMSATGLSLDRVKQDPAPLWLAAGAGALALLSTGLWHRQRQRKAQKPAP
ncbi:MAG: hypothetical protein OIF40_01700 [Mangrovicoccus sp.]|nr:hypothetical protein [Mangrovicoccus sp.]